MTFDCIEMLFSDFHSTRATEIVHVHLGVLFNPHELQGTTLKAIGHPVLETALVKSLQTELQTQLCMPGSECFGFIF